MSEDKDLKLIQLIKSGDERALNALFETYYFELCAFINSIVSAPEISEELVADLFANLWQKRETLEIHKNVKGYLVISAKNQALQFLRKKRMYFLNFDSLSNIAGTETPDSNLNFEDTKQSLNSIIREFPQKTKSIFLLNRKLKFTYKEISSILEISEKTVEKHMSNALSILRASFRRK